MTKPFRWSIEKREQLGRLLSDENWSVSTGFLTTLRDAAARVIAMADNADLALIGRTPENFFDYLSGAFHGLEKVPKLHLIQISLHGLGGNIGAIPQSKLLALFEYFRQERIDPTSIAAAEHPLALIDYVDTGGSMHTFVKLLHQQSLHDGADWNVAQRRLRIIGLCMRTKTSPNTWRWHQHQDWLSLIPNAQIKNVSIERVTLRYLADIQTKVTQEFGYERWDAEDGRLEVPTEGQREALTLATKLFDLGRTSEERLNLAAKIAKTYQMRQTATRSLVTALKQAG